MRKGLYAVMVGTAAVAMDVLVSEDLKQKARRRFNELSLRAIPEGIGKWNHDALRQELPEMVQYLAGAGLIDIPKLPQVEDIQRYSNTQLIGLYWTIQRYLTPQPNISDSYSDSEMPEFRHKYNLDYLDYFNRTRNPVIFATRKKAKDFY